MSLVCRFHFILQNHQSAMDWKFTKVKTKQKNGGLSFTQSWQITIVGGYSGQRVGKEAWIQLGKC